MADIVQGIKIEADASQANEEIDNFEKLFGEKMDSAGKSAVIFNKILDVGAKALSAMGDALGTAIRSAIEYEQSIVKLESALRGQGFNVETNVAAINALSSKMQNLTGISDDTIRSMATLAVNFGAAPSKIEDYVSAAVRMSNVLGTDLNQALTAIMKAESGVADETLRMIPGVQNLTAEQLKNGQVADVVNSVYGDQIDVLTKGAAGQERGLINAVDDLAKSIGKVIQKIEFFTKPMKGLAQGVEGVSIMMDKMVEETGSGFAGLFAGVAGAVDLVWNSGEGVAKVWAEHNKQLDEASKKTDDATKKVRRLNRELLDALKKQFDFSSTSPDQLYGPGQGPLGAVDKDAFGANEERFQARKALFDRLTSIEDEGLKEIRQKNEEHQAHMETVDQATADQRLLAFQEWGSRYNSIQSSITNTSLDLFEQWVGGQEIALDAMLMALLKSLGRQLFAQGTVDAMKGVSRGLSSYGFDPTAYGLITLGAAEQATGLAMIAGSSHFSGGSGGGGGGGGGRGSSRGGGRDRSAGAGGAASASGGKREDKNITIRVEGAMTTEEQAATIQEGLQMAINKDLL